MTAPPASPPFASRTSSGRIICTCDTHTTSPITSAHSCSNRNPRSGADSASVTPLAALVRAYRAQEIDPAERRPQHVAEIEFAVRRLPDQETGQPLLAAGADDEVRVGHAAGVEVAFDVAGLEIRHQRF